MSLKRVKALSGIKERKSELGIGAATTLSESCLFSVSSLILSQSVSEAARLVAAPPSGTSQPWGAICCRKADAFTTISRSSQGKGSDPAISSVGKFATQ